MMKETVLIVEDEALLRMDAVDIVETENELVVKADLPDVKTEDIGVHVENQTLTIKGERKFESEQKEENFHRIERRFGTLRQAVGRFSYNVIEKRLTQNRCKPMSRRSW